LTTSAPTRLGIASSTLAAMFAPAHKVGGLQAIEHTEAYWWERHVIFREQCRGCLGQIPCCGQHSDHATCYKLQGCDRPSSSKSKGWYCGPCSRYTGYTANVADWFRDGQIECAQCPLHKELYQNGLVPPQLLDTYNGVAARIAAISRPATGWSAAWSPPAKARAVLRTIRSLSVGSVATIDSV